ncbi:MAG: DUF1236 domain-containing protein [Hyphomicrobiaceae bacterium]|nr:DUF1236 domain-containing protein [Hyphomicrobiaceae bacterium]
MNKTTVSLSMTAALMLSVAHLSSSVAFAQEKDDKASSMQESGGEKAPSSSSSRERAPDSAKSTVQDADVSETKQKNAPADKADNKDQSKSASDQKERNDKSASDKGDKDGSKSRSADRQGDKDASKQSEGKTDRDPSRKADTAPAAKSGDNASNNKSNDKANDSDRNADANKSADDSKRAAGGDSAKADKAKSADLSGDKKERVKTSFKSENVKRITNVNVDISVGRRLPRDWEYHSVPTAVIEIVPEYRGYRYAYVEDRYVIVDPETYEVVYVLDDTGGGSASVGRSTGESGSARCSTDLTFSQEDRVFIVEKVRSSSATVKIGNLEIGAALPSDAKVEVFPSEVTTRVTKLDACRYVVIDDKVAVIDPNDDKIVAIIED